MEDKNKKSAKKTPNKNAKRLSVRDLEQVSGGMTNEQVIGAIQKLTSGKETKL